jgi:pilus assembly protein FimV
MASGSQKFIARNRAPRVQIEYDVELYGAEKKVQLPFVMGVMSDLAGKSETPQPSIADRKFLEIDVDNFDARMKAMKPRAAFTVPNTLTGDGNLAVDITFESMEDFAPAAIAAKIEPLRKLLDARTQLSNLMTYMDGKAGAETLIEQVLQDGALLNALASGEADQANQSAVLAALRANAPDPEEATKAAEAERASALDALRAAQPVASEEPDTTGAALDALRAAQPVVEAEPDTKSAALEALRAAQPVASAEPDTKSAALEALRAAQPVASAEPDTKSAALDALRAAQPVAEAEPDTKGAALDALRAAQPVAEAEPDTKGAALDALRAAQPVAEAEPDTKGAALDALRAAQPVAEAEPDTKGAALDALRAAQPVADKEPDLKSAALEALRAAQPVAEEEPDTKGAALDALRAAQPVAEAEPDTKGAALDALRAAQPVAEEEPDTKGAALDALRAAQPVAEAEPDTKGAALDALRAAQPVAEAEPDTKGAALDALRAAQPVAEDPGDDLRDILGGMTSSQEDADPLADLLADAAPMGEESAQDHSLADLLGDGGSDDPLADILADASPTEAEVGADGPDLADLLGDTDDNALEDLLADTEAEPDFADLEEGEALTSDPAPAAEVDPLDDLDGLLDEPAASAPADDLDALLDVPAAEVDPLDDLDGLDGLLDAPAAAASADDLDALLDAPAEEADPLDDLDGLLDAPAAAAPADDLDSLLDTPAAEADPLDDLDGLLDAPAAEEDPFAGLDDLDDLLAGLDDPELPEGAAADPSAFLLALNPEPEPEPLPDPEPEPDPLAELDELDALLAGFEEEDAAADSSAKAEDDDMSLLDELMDGPKASAAAQAAPTNPFGTLSAPKPSAEALERPQFKIALFGDFSGRSSRGLVEIGAALAARRAIALDVDTVEDVIEGFATTLVLPIGPDGKGIAVKLNELDDLHPDELVDNLELFDALKGLRQRLANASTAASAVREMQGWGESFKSPARATHSRSGASSIPANKKLSDFQMLIGDSAGALSQPSPIDDLIGQIIGPHVVPGPNPEAAALKANVDEAMSSAMRLVLHHPDFQALEAQWRSLDLIARRVETDVKLQITLYDISAEEIATDIAQSEDLAQTGLFKLLNAPLEEEGGVGYSALFGMYTFEETPPHAELLARVAQIAAHVQAPFFTAMAPGFMGVELKDRHPLTAEAWDKLRGIPEAAYLGLVSPRFMLRRPYGKKSEPIDAFEFEEFTEQEGLKSLLWANPIVLVMILLAQEWKDGGKRMTLGNVMSLDDVPFHYVKDKYGDQVALPCTERNLTESKVQMVVGRGFMPVVSIRGRDVIRLASFQSVAGAEIMGPWTGAAAKEKARKAVEMEISMVTKKPAAPAATAAAEDDLDALLAGFGDSAAPTDPAAIDDDLAALLEGL